MTTDESINANVLNKQDFSGNKPDNFALHLPATLTFNDRFGNVMCRMSNRFRMKYKIAPGLYSVGNPDQNSPVLVSCNYRLSINKLRSVLVNRAVWLLIIDTRGINVWCAAGKGTFCSGEISRQINACDLRSKVTHRILILPQLGASGVSASKLHAMTGFAVKFGPVRATDIPAYLDNHNTATSEMRFMHFSITDRAELIPMELIPAFKKTGFFIFLAAVLFGATPEGIIFKKAMAGILPFAVAGLTAVLSGSFLTPLLLPVIPGRAFSFKGLITGSVSVLAIMLFLPEYRINPLYMLFFIFAIPAFSSYLAFLFTGSSTYTSPSGVKSELKIAWPLYLASASVSLILFLVALIRFWRLS